MAGIVRGGGVLRIEHDASIQREQTFVRGEQRIDIDFLDPGLFGHQVTEADQQFSQGRKIHRLASAHAAQSA